MLARLQRLTVSIILAASIGWYWYWGAGSAALAVMGSLCVVFSYSVVLACQFAVMATINRMDRVPAAGIHRLVHAWVQETAVAALVFFWWQPFRSAAIPDHLLGTPVQGIRGVVFLHGFLCNRGIWTPWLRVLRQRNIPFTAINLEPIFGSIDAYVTSVDLAVRRVTRLTGKPPLLVCHSMGGLVARAWLRGGGGDDRVHHVITIGSPHSGTAVGHLNPAETRITNGSQMRSGSAWLARLAEEEPPERAARFTCFYSNCDNIVVPASAATLTGADNRFLPGVPHVALALHPVVMQQSLDFL